MAINVTMPALGTVSDETKVIEWLVKEGEEVKKGQALFTAESDKATQEVEALASGVIAKIITPPGSMAKTGEVLAVIIQPGEEYSGAASVEEKPEKKIDSKPSPKITLSHTDSRGKSAGFPATPKAKKFAREKGIPLGSVSGSGPQGRIMYGDLVKFLETQGVSQVPDLTIPVSVKGRTEDVTGLRASVAKHMMLSLQSSAQVTNFSEILVDELVSMREALKPEFTGAGLELPYDLLVAKLTAYALEEFPFMITSWTDAGIVYHSAIHIGIAVDVAGGLIVPVLRNVKERKLSDLSRELSAMIDRAKRNQSTSDDLTGGTFTISNIGMYAVDGFTPVINMPQSAILGLGRIIKKPVVREDQVIPAYTMMLSLTFDHRIIDGAPAARFLTRLGNILTNPFSSLLNKIL
jgi:pyruvate dehydrogenase E2 component (dihydrolipoamide acetyltransferase)